MKALHSLHILAGALALACTLSVMPAYGDDLSNPINPNAPSPNAGVAPGHRAAGPSASKRPGNLPKYGERPHSYTGVDSKTP